MKGVISYNGTSHYVDIITDSYSRTDILYNDSLKQADNSVKCSIVWNQAVADFIKLNINNDILCTLWNDLESHKLFTGYLRKNVTFSKTQTNEPIALEIVSPSFKLNKKVSSTQVYVQETLATIVTGILSDAGITDIGDLSALTAHPHVVVVKKDENIKEVLNELLFEYKFSFDFDNNGTFYVFEIFNPIATGSVETQINNSHILNKIQIVAKERAHDWVKGICQVKKRYISKLIFQDRTNGDSSHECLQPVAANSYFGNTEYNYLDCDSDRGEIAYIEALTVQGITTDSNKLTWTLSTTEDGEPLIDHLLFSAYNSDSVEHNITKMRIFGTFWAKSDVIINRSNGTKNCLEYDLKYVDSEAAATSFVEAYCNYFRYANNSIKFDSDINLILGEYVKVTDNGVGTYYGKVIKKTSKLKTNTYGYELEQLKEYTPSSVETETYPGIGKVGMETINASLQEAFSYTDAEIASAEFQVQPLKDVRYNCDILKRTEEGEYSPTVVKAEAVEVAGDSSYNAFYCNFHIYINGSFTEWAVVNNVDEISLSIADLLAEFGSISSIRIEARTLNDAYLIEDKTIPVLSNASVYSIVLDNAYQVYECNAEGNVISTDPLVIKPRVYYGLTEVEYGADGWGFGNLPTVAGFDISVNQNNGEITITAQNGSSMALKGNISFPIYIHSQDDDEYRLGYEDGNDTYVYGYTVDGESYILGYSEAGDNGYIYVSFGYAKLLSTALQVASVADRVTVLETAEYKGKINNIASIPLHPVTGDFFLWSGANGTLYHQITLNTGSLYRWNGTNWIPDEEDKDVMTAFSDSLSILQTSTDESIKAVLLAKQIAAMSIVVNTLMANELIVRNTLRSENNKFIVDATDGILKANGAELSNITSNGGVFYNFEAHKVKAYDLVINTGLRYGGYESISSPIYLSSHIWDMFTTFTEIDNNMRYYSCMARFSIRDIDTNTRYEFTGSSIHLTWDQGFLSNILIVGSGLSYKQDAGSLPSQKYIRSLEIKGFTGPCFLHGTENYSQNWSYEIRTGHTDISGEFCV